MLGQNTELAKRKPRAGTSTKYLYDGIILSGKEIPVSIQKANKMFSVKCQKKKKRKNMKFVPVCIMAY